MYERSRDFYILTRGLREIGKFEKNSTSLLRGYREKEVIKRMDALEHEKSDLW